MKFNTLLSALLLTTALSTGSAIAAQTLQTDQIVTKSSSLVTLRSVGTETSEKGISVKGRLTFDVLARDQDMGEIIAEVIGTDGEVLERQAYPLERLSDDMSQRFGRFEFTLNTVDTAISRIQLSHQPD